MGKNVHDSVGLVLSRVLDPWRHLEKSVQNLTESLREEIGHEVFTNIVPDVEKLQTELKNALLRFENAADRPEVILATTGTTSSGKSTLANFLIGEMLLPKAVQEMSAGVVTIRHHADKRELVVEETSGATWPTGKWEALSAKDLRDRLSSVMKSYRDQVVGVSSGADRLEPPRFEISWPTLIGAEPQRFGLPPQANITIIDLPGLKYVNDEINGKVIREQVKKALCLVTYNASETDAQKRDALLRQIVDQVKAMGGSPARMMFVLNRIDVFRTDDDPVASERSFCDEVTGEFRKRLKDALPEYASIIEAIEPIPFSSEPALYAIIARHREGEEQAELLKRLEQDYGNLLSSEEFESFPRTHATWTPKQRQWFIDHTLERSRAHQFEHRLHKHISDNLPELLLPDLVDGVYQPARKILEKLDALIDAYSKQEQEQLNNALEQLNDLYSRLKELPKQALAPLDPILKAAKSRDPSREDFYKILYDTLFNPSTSADAPHSLLSPINDALSQIIQDPFNRLTDFVNRRMEGEEFEDSFIEACNSADDLREAISKLRNTPYPDNAESEHIRFEGDDAEAVRSALDDFAKAMSKIATELIARESVIQAERIKTAFNAYTAAIADEIEAKAEPIIAELGFPGLRGVFRGEFDLSPPQLPSVTFACSISEWTKRTEKYEKETYFEDERVWWKLWLGTAKVKKTKLVLKVDERHGIKVAKFVKLLDALLKTADLQSLINYFADWIVEKINFLAESFQQHLSKGVKTYRLAFEQRSEELKSDTHKRIEDINARRGEVNEALRSVEANRNWRSLSSIQL